MLQHPGLEPDTVADPRVFTAGHHFRSAVVPIRAYKRKHL